MSLDKSLCKGSCPRDFQERLDRIKMAAEQYTHALELVNGSPWPPSQMDQDILSYGVSAWTAVAEDVCIVLAAYEEANRPFAALGKAFASTPTLADYERPGWRDKLAICTHESGICATFGDLGRAAELEG